MSLVQRPVAPPPVRPTRVTQTILATDPKRPGNCVAACVASYFGIDLDQVPHFLELGAAPHETVDADAADTTHWWAMFLGFMAGGGLWPVQLESLDQGEPGELLFVARPSIRGVMYQVLYRDGELWHDPHPSHDGITEVQEVIAFRSGRHDHTPTASEDGEG